MRHFKTLRVRFAIWTALLLLGVLAAFGAFVYVSLAQGLSASIDDSLRVSASQAIAAVNIENGELSLSDILPQGTSDVLRNRGLTIRVLSPAGQSLDAFGPFHALPVSADSLDSARRGQSAFSSLSDPVSHEPVRVYTAPVVDNGKVIGIVQVAQSAAEAEATLNRLLTALFIGGPLLSIGAALGGYVLAARALAPIDQITRMARRISAEDLSARLHVPPSDDEVGRLAVTLDGMLARLDDSFKRERQFAADASHELRTPLAAMQAILSVIRSQRRTPEDYEHALGDLAEAADRLQSLVEDLLRLARGETQNLALRELVDLSLLLADVTDSLRPLAEAKALTLRCDVPPALSIMGDRDGLIRLFVNLVDNAVKYTASGGIAVTARADGQSLSVTVGDTGAGIPAEYLPHIFDRFFRADSARDPWRGPGSGYCARYCARARRHARSEQRAGQRLDVHRTLAARRIRLTTP